MHPQDWKAQVIDLVAKKKIFEKKKQVIVTVHTQTQR
jgi:hypothetical protein